MLLAFLCRRKQSEQAAAPLYARADMACESLLTTLLLQTCLTNTSKQLLSLANLSGGPWLSRWPMAHLPQVEQILKHSVIASDAKVCGQSTYTDSKISLLKSSHCRAHRSSWNAGPECPQCGPSCLATWQAWRCTAMRTTSSSMLLLLALCLASSVLVLGGYAMQTVDSWSYKPLT